MLVVLVFLYLDLVFYCYYMGLWVCWFGCFDLVCFVLFGALLGWLFWVVCCWLLCVLWLVVVGFGLSCFLCI